MKLIRTFSELTKLILHICHRVPLRGFLLLLLRSGAVATGVVLLLRDGRVSARSIGELARLLLLLLLPSRDLFAGVLLLVLEQQLARKLLV